MVAGSIYAVSVWMTLRFALNIVPHLKIQGISRSIVCDFVQKRTAWKTL